MQQVAGARRSKRKHSGDEVEVKVSKNIVDALSSIKVNVRRQNTEVKTVFLGIIFLAPKGALETQMFVRHSVRIMLSKRVLKSS